MVNDLQSASYTPALSYSNPNGVLERGARGYSQHFVPINMATNALLTSGTVADKLEGGLRGGVEAYTLSKLSRWMNRLTDKLYASSPAYANFVNNHPVMGSMVNGAIVIIPALIGTVLSGQLFTWAFNRLGGGRAKDALDNSHVGQKTNAFLNRPGMQKAGRIVRGALLIGGPLFFLALGAKRLMDAARFKREYREAKAEYPNLSTYELQNLAALDRQATFAQLA